MVTNQCPRCPSSLATKNTTDGVIEGRGESRDLLQKENLLESPCPSFLSLLAPSAAFRLNRWRARASSWPALRERRRLLPPLEIGPDEVTEG
eukprot:2217674-Pyramimonas_sp.AAC.1